MAKNKGQSGATNPAEQNAAFPTEPAQQTGMNQQNRQNNKKGSSAQNKGGQNAR